MKVLIGTGNAVTKVFSVSAKTIAFSGAYNFDIIPDGNFSVYSVTASKWIYGGGVTGASPGTTATVATTFTAGAPVQTVTFNQLPSGVADGDTLIITVDCPPDIANYNAIVSHA